MNGTGDGEKPESNKNIISLVVFTLALNATIGFSTLAYCIVTKTQPDPVLLTGFVAIVNYILGVLSGMLIKSSPTASTPPDAPITPAAPTGTVTVPEQKLETTTKP